MQGPLPVRPPRPRRRRQQPLPPAFAYLTAGLSALPGLVGVIFSLNFSQDYFGPSLTLTATVLLVVGGATGWMLGRQDWPRRDTQLFGVAILVSVIVGWLAAMLVNAILNITPLCVGRDNGDGINDLGMCLGYTLMYLLVYTPMVAIIGAGCAIIGTLLCPRPTIVGQRAD